MADRRIKSLLDDLAPTLRGRGRGHFRGRSRSQHRFQPYHGNRPQPLSHSSVVEQPRSQSTSSRGRASGRQSWPRAHSTTPSSRGGFQRSRDSSSYSSSRGGTSDPPSSRGRSDESSDLSIRHLSGQFNQLVEVVGLLANAISVQNQTPVQPGCPAVLAPSVASPTTDPTFSSHPHFRKIVSNIETMARNEHHIHLWSDEKSSKFSEELKRVFDTLEIPGSDAILRDTLEEVRESTAFKVVDVIKTHLNSASIDLLTEIVDLKPSSSDLIKAGQVAHSYLRKKLSKNLPQDYTMRLVDSAVKAVKDRSLRSSAPDDLDLSDVKAPAETASNALLSQASNEDLVELTDQVMAEIDIGTGAVASTPRPQRTLANLASRFQMSTLNVSPLKRDEIGQDAAPDSVPHDPSTSTQLKDLSIQVNKLQTGTHNTSMDLPVTSTPLVITRPIPGFVLYKGQMKFSWSPQPKPEFHTIILADSNFQQVNIPPVGMEIHCMPGARLDHVTRAISRITSDKQINLLIQVGINNRQDMHGVMEASIQRFAQAVASATWIKRVFALGVSAAASLPPGQLLNVQMYNQLISRTVGPDSFIPPLPYEQVQIRARDVSMIHHSHDTVERVLSSIDHFFARLA